jgi:hypothetical protein
MAIPGGLENDPLARFLVEGGAVVSGSAALLAAGGYLAWSLARDLGRDADPFLWPERSGCVGGVFGLAMLTFRAVGLSLDPPIPAARSRPRGLATARLAAACRRQRPPAELQRGPP